MAANNPPLEYGGRNIRYDHRQQKAAPYAACEQMSTGTTTVHGKRQLFLHSHFASLQRHRRLPLCLSCMESGKFELLGQLIRDRMAALT